MVKMKTLLLYPRFNEKVPFRVPLGIAYIAAYLKKEGFPFFLREGAFYRTIKDFQKDLLKNKPDILGISASSFTIKKAMMYTKAAKEVLPGIKVVFGGPHSCVYPKETLKQEEIDFIIYGEGEITFLELVKALSFKQQLSSVLGLGYKKGKKIVINKPRPFLDMDSRPLPLRSELLMEKYLSAKPTMPLPYPSTDVEASRGCFGNCLFCQPVLRKMFGPKVRNRNVKELVDEIDYLVKKYKVRGINLGTDEPVVYRKWTRAFCREMIKRKVKVKITVSSRVDTIDLVTMKMMKRAGFINLSFGVESLSQDILNTFRKGINVEKIKNAFKLSQQVGICGRANLMVGSPGESKESIQRVIDFIKESKPDLIYLSATTPTPGSDLFDYAKEHKMLTTSDFDKYEAFDVGYMKMKNFSNEDIYESIQKIARAYKIELIKYFINPVMFVKKFYLFKEIFIHYWTMLLKNPSEVFRDFKYLINYGRHIKKKKI